MKKNYSSPQMDYWCYIAGQLCDGVGAKLYARTSGSGDPGHNTGGGITNPASSH